MYSMVLMAALTTGSATPDWHCHRGGCCGCYGGCYGCWGGCYGGCYGCFGGCYGGCWGGCYGGWGGCYGCWGGYSSWGCCGCMGTYYGAPTYPGSIVPSGGMMAPGGAMPGAPAGEQLGEPKKNGKSTMAPSKAKLIVELPADAQLYIDDLPMKNASGTRAFSTPTLDPGQAYYYMVRAEVMRDGKPVSETRRVIVRAGQTVRADFRDLETEAVRTAQAK
jgi:uncharacterized protein (TIGR03000 family)